MNLVFLSFIKSLELSFYMKAKHYYTKSMLKDVGLIKSKIYDFYHLHMIIINCWNWFLEFIHLFLAIDHDVIDSKVLLDRPILKDFKINICNDDDS